jgi:hypothetical protein
MIGPIFLVNAPTIVRGGFHPRYLLSVPIALAAAVAAAFIPTGDYPLGIVSIGVIALVLGFVFCVCLLYVPFFATDEHKALDQTFGPPALVVGILFFLLMVAHVYLTRSSANMLIGLLLPIGCVATRTMALFVLARCCRRQYCEPKENFLATGHVRAGVLPVRTHRRHRGTVWVRCRIFRAGHRQHTGSEYDRRGDV